MAQKNKAKFKYQQKMVDAIDKKFHKSLKLRNILIKSLAMKIVIEITSLDLLMSELIKKELAIP